MTRVLSRRRVLALGALATTSAVIGLGGRKQPSPAERESASEPDDEVRRVAGVFEGTPSIDGAGVHLTRMLGARSLPMLDPFLLLDQIHSENPDDYVRGFPRHPHRGFETVTYMIAGAMQHRDILGNHGWLGPGAAQWMTAGHGIVHEEMPRQDAGELWGFQFWVNLPRRSKLIPPRYQDIPPGDVAELSVTGSRVRLVAGRVEGVTGPVNGIEVEPTLLDATLSDRGRLGMELPLEHTAFVLMLRGEARIAGTRVHAGQLAVLSSGRQIDVTADVGARLLLAAGRPLHEPVARRGPFVMNTEDELDQAFEDYRAGRLMTG